MAAEKAEKAGPNKDDAINQLCSQAFHFPFTRGED
jgi:hypothetical protein